MIAKAEKKGRKRNDVFEVTQWLFGYTNEELEALLVFLPLYAILPTLWGAQTWAEAGQELLHCYINFPVSGSHLWFVYMLMLPHWFGLYNPLLPEWLTIPATAVSTYICCFCISWAIGKLPLGKYVVG